MALLIKDTPVLTGKDAKKFVEKYINSNISVLKNELERMISNYNRTGNIKMIEKVSQFIYSFSKQSKESRKREQELLDFIDMGLEFVDIGNGYIGINANIEKPSSIQILNFMKVFASTMQESLCHTDSVKNYLELNMNDLSGRNLSLILVKHNGKSPHKIRMELENEIKELKEKLSKYES